MEEMVLEQKAKDYDRDLQIIHRAIEEKLNLHDRLNRKLAKLIDSSGGNENNPIQLKVRFKLKKMVFLHEKIYNFYIYYSLPLQNKI